MNGLYGCLVRPKEFWLIGTPICLGLILAFLFLSRPYDGWEWLNRAAAESILKTGLPHLPFPLSTDRLLLFHPPSWCYLAGLTANIFGGSEWAYRAHALIVFVLAGWIGTLILKELGGGLKEASLFLYLYMTNPAAVQGFLSMDFSDGNLLPLTTLLFILLWLRAEKIQEPFPWLRTGFAFCLCLWAKLTTPLALPLCSLWRVGILRTLKWAVCGGLLFLASWSLYCGWVVSRVSEIHFSSLLIRPLSYLWEGFGWHPPGTRPLHMTILYVTRVVLYFGVFLVPVGAWGAWEAFKQKRGQILWLFGGIVFLTYFAVEAAAG
ncbi:MAG: hypothetical protein HY400_00385, partial [Elusimicrobia bacterium]|nr:hypothetical protein [Elusimicrobiota bacterium]